MSSRAKAGASSGTARRPRFVRPRRLEHGSADPRTHGPLASPTALSSRGEPMWRGTVTEIGRNAHVGARAWLRRIAPVSPYLRVAVDLDEGGLAYSAVSGNHGRSESALERTPQCPASPVGRRRRRGSPRPWRCCSGCLTYSKDHWRLHTSRRRQRTA